MSTIKSYLKNKNIFTGEVLITEIIAGERNIVRVEESYFHPQGGGQKADRGSIGKSNVIHVAHNGPFVDHTVDTIEGLMVGQKYPFSIDRDWRKLNSLYHTAGHLIAAIVENLHPELVAVAGHQWPGEARVEFRLRNPQSTMPSLDVQTIEKACTANITQCQRVTVEGDPFTSRSIMIGQYTPIPCGGTHVDDLSEIGQIKINYAKAKGGQVKVSFEAFEKSQDLIDVLALLSGVAQA